ncbi:dipeptidase PepE [Aestuariibacter halophilus]|uniref:Dipeptidase PepE n=1 Tax=Fluctibacter halophilus TaxID=226011 RepID=A0ABS8G7G7_9ALTE|nr:dipeptidase PepE [Aestuariibacter halophilus]MCC2616076.1 dipeptidase PepE [Aestuariibacter halophilus]
MNLLMLSSSRAGTEDYLASARPMIEQHLDEVRDVVFIPYAGVTLNWDDYTDKVQQALPTLNITGIHTYADPVDALQDAKAVLVGGGNTFHLLHTLYENSLIEPLRQRVADGLPYVGWSAGSNICGLSIRTTNDMPIIEPASFTALALVPFQINPHYSDYQPPGHNGETRAERIAEFCALNPTTPVIGIREGTGLLRKGNTLQLTGPLPGVVFKGTEVSELSAGSNLDHYLTETA